MLLRLVFPSLLLCASGCLTPPARGCTVDLECQLEGREGVCTPLSYCAYPNDACEGRYSYSPYAPPELANTCVAADVGTSSTGGPVQTESTGEPMACDETCDGVTVLDRAPADGAVLIDVALGEDGVVVGAQSGEDARVVRLDGTASLDVPGMSLRSVVLSLDELFVAGSVGGVPTLRHLDPAGQTISTRRWDTAGDDALLAASPAADGGVLVAGLQRGRPWIEQLDDEANTEWVRVWAGEEPVALIGRGGFSHVLLRDAATVQAHTFTNAGANPSSSVEIEVSPELVAAASTLAGVVLLTDDHVWVGGHDLEPTLQLDLPATYVAATLDGTGRLVLARTDGGLVLDTYESSGVAADSFSVTSESVGTVRMSTDPNGHPVVVAASTDEFVAWRLDR